MGRARDLSMGERPRRPRLASGGPYAVVRRQLAAATPDPVVLRAALDAIAAQPHRLRYTEGQVYLSGCELYRLLTGEAYGPRRGTY
jgi:hypothetical protein